jgi:predicted transcriptional regulator
MVCAVLRTPVAVQRSVQIMRAFSSLEEVMSTRRKLITQSPSVLNKLSVHSRAIMCLFQKDKIKTLEIEKVRKIIKEMILLLQNMVLRSE